LLQSSIIDFTEDDIREAEEEENIDIEAVGIETLEVDVTVAFGLEETRVFREGCLNKAGDDGSGLEDDEEDKGEVVEEKQVAVDVKAGDAT